MTGCPNGCSRPYMAEIGLVGDGPNSYQLYLGGSANQTRLAEVYMDRMKMQVRSRAMRCQFLQHLVFCAECRNAVCCKEYS